MRKIILDLAVTLDGFIEGPNGEVDWCIMDDNMGFDKFLDSIDSIFYGRVSYDIWGQFQPDSNLTPAERNIWKQVHEKKKFVFSRNPKKDKNVTYISSDIAGSVNEIKNQPGKNIWLYGGANLITTFVNYNLIDIYRLAVHPVILGTGKPLFSDIQQRVNLKMNEIKSHSSVVTFLNYVTDTRSPVNERN